jgi:hypothetical protein
MKPHSSLCSVSCGGGADKIRGACRALHRKAPCILGGRGKTTVVRGFLRWLDETNGLDGALWFDFRDIRPAEYVIKRIGEAFYGANLVSPLRLDTSFMRFLQISPSLRSRQTRDEDHGKKPVSEHSQPRSPNDPHAARRRHSRPENNRSASPKHPLVWRSRVQKEFANHEEDLRFLKKR